MNPYYQELFERIEQLIADDSIEEVMRIVNEELAMPYIPEDVEERLLELKFQFNEEETSTGGLMQDIDLIYEALVGSVELKIKALESLEKLNVRPYVDTVREILVDERIEDDLKRHILMILVSQQIQGEIDLLFEGEVHSMTMSELKNPFETEHFFKVLQALRFHYMQNPSLLELSVQELLGQAHYGFPFDMDGYSFESVKEAIETYMNETI